MTRPIGQANPNPARCRRFAPQRETARLRHGAGAQRSEGDSAVTQFDDKPGDSGSTGSTGGGFDLNRPTIISLLYLAGYFTGVTTIVGVVLGYVWKNEPQGEWEVSHYQYLIRTFWIGLIGTIAGFVLLVVLVGILILIAVAIQVIVRCVLSLLAAQKHQPMPNPESWTI